VTQITLRIESRNLLAPFTAKLRHTPPLSLLHIGAVRVQWIVSDA
jgi:hypothetical protein